MHSIMLAVDAMLSRCFLNIVFVNIFPLCLKIWHLSIFLLLTKTEVNKTDNITFYCNRKNTLSNFKCGILKHQNISNESLNLSQIVIHVHVDVFNVISLRKIWLCKFPIYPTCPRFLTTWSVLLNIPLR